MTRLLFLIFSLSLASSAAAPLAAQGDPPKGEPLLLVVEHPGVHLARDGDGRLYVSASPAAVPIAAAPVSSAPLVLASQPLPNRWEGAWAGAKTGALVGLIAGGTLVVAGALADVNGACGDCHFGYTVVAAVVAVPLIATTTVGGALVGFVSSTD